jgi:uncharacterized protein (DUF433 family)
MNINSHAWKHLDRKPGSSYKQLFVKGRNIAARTLYGRYMSEDEPMTPQEIAADYELPLEAVLEAIAYCKSDPPEIAADWAAEEALAQATGMNDPAYSGKPKLLSPQERARLSRL